MKISKSVVAVLWVLLLLISLVGCGSNEKLESGSLSQANMESQQPKEDSSQGEEKPQSGAEATKNTSKPEGIGQSAPAKKLPVPKNHPPPSPPPRFRAPFQ